MQGQGDYQTRILEAHRKLQSACEEDEGRQKEVLESGLKRLKELYRWGQLTREEYLAEYKDTQHELEKLAPVEDKSKLLQRLAHFLANVGDAWEEAPQEERNKVARTLFERIEVQDSKVVFVKPNPELQPFFRINFERHARDIGSDPEGG